MRSTTNKLLMGALGLALILPAPLAKAADNSRLMSFMAATQAYNNGDYATAEKGFSDLIAQDGESGAVWYNLGNTYYRQGQNGAALWAFKEARKLAPRWDNLDTNIALVTQKAVDELPPLHPAWQRTLFFWHYIFSARERLVLLALCNLIFWSLLIIGRKRPNELTSLGQVISLVLLLAMGGSLIAENFFTREEGVIRTATAKIHSAGDVSSQVLFELHECTELFIENDQNGWLQISLSDGKRGWVAADDVAYRK